MDTSSEAAPSTSAPADAAVSPPSPAPIPQGNGSGAPDAETVSDSFRVLLAFARFFAFRNEVFFFSFPLSVGVQRAWPLCPRAAQTACSLTT